jgi:hypothetical protein
LVNEITRSQVVVELLANFVLAELFAKKISQPTEQGIVKILQYLDFGKTVTFKSVKNEFDTQAELWKKRKWSAESKVSELAFWQSIDNLLKGLQVPRSVAITSQNILGLYGYLEQAQVNFIARAVKNAPQGKIDELGSDSECEGEIRDVILYAKKLITTSGMMAIGCAYFVAQYFLKEHAKVLSANVSFDTMYFEINDALKLAKDYATLKMSLDPKNYVGPNYILFFDLNYCNAANLTTDPLEVVLQKQKPKVVILDSTSATTTRVHAALTTIITTPETQAIQLIIIISSGLKNEAAGSDNNPYGTLRIFSPETDITSGIYSQLSQRLKKDNNYISTTAHQIRRKFKECTFSPRNRYYFDETDDEA